MDGYKSDVYLILFVCGLRGLLVGFYTLLDAIEQRVTQAKNVSLFFFSLSLRECLVVCVMIMKREMSGLSLLSS